MTMRLPFSKHLDVESLARPQLSVSDSCVPALWDRDAASQIASPSSYRNSTQVAQEESSDFEWCQQLTEAADLTTLRPELLDMFGQWEAGQGCYALLSDEKQQVKKLKGVQAAQAFYNKPSTGYLVAIRNSWKHVQTQSKVRELTAEALSCYLVVRLTAPVTCIKRIAWHRDAHLKPRGRYLSPTFQHDLRTFRYAGRLKKSSFSPYMPYRSVLREKLPHVTCPHADRLAALVLGVLARDRLAVKSMELHVLEDASGTTHLLNVSRIVWVEKERHTLPPVISISRALPAKQTSSCKLATRENAHSLFCRRIAHPPYIDLTDIQQQNINLYNHTFSDRLHNTEHTSQPPSPVSLTLSEVAEKLDSHRRNRQHVSPEPQKLRAAVRDVCRVLPRDNVLTPLLGKEHNEDQLYFALASPKNQYLTHRVQKVHRPLAISEKQFQHFAQVVREAVRDNSITDEDCVMARLFQYREDIVTE